MPNNNIDKETLKNKLSDIAVRESIRAMANKINADSHGAGSCYELWEVRRIEAAKDAIEAISNPAHRTLFLQTFGMTEDELLEDRELGWDCDVCGKPLTETELVYSLNSSGTGLCSTHSDV